MADESAEVVRLKCSNCGFESHADGDGWTSAAHPSLGTLTQCGECGSTNVHNLD